MTPQHQILLTSLAFASTLIMLIYVWFRLKQSNELSEQRNRFHNNALRENAALSSQLTTLQKVFNDQLVALKKVSDQLSTEKATALQQYHSTATLLDVAHKKIKELEKSQETQNIKHGDELYKQQKTIRELELQLNQVIGHYQAEKQRNLLTEHAHISESIAKLTTLEQQLAARDTTA